MQIKLFYAALIAILVASCSGHSHSEEYEHEHDSEMVHEEEHEHEEVKLQYTVYSNEFELFAEADPFIVGGKANVLSHFSMLPSFKALEDAAVTIKLSVNGKTVEQTLQQPTRKGICCFDIQPKEKGKGVLVFEIESKDTTFNVIVPEVLVYTNHEAAHIASKEETVSHTNTTVFTKEQSWKIDFATAMPAVKPFGQVIKATALVKSVQGEEVIVAAKTNGFVQFKALLEGQDVKAGEVLVKLSANGLTDDNFVVKYTEAKSNYEKAKADYERAEELAKTKIVSEKELLVAKNQFEKEEANYNNLRKNANASGQQIASPKTGFIKQVLVQNGTYVEAGQPIAVISQSNLLMLTAEVASKYSVALSKLETANVRSSIDKSFYTLEQLNGKVLSVAKATNSDNYLLPVSLQIENNGTFVPGSFVEVYLKTETNVNALVVPTSALLEEQGNFFVWVQVTPELFEKRVVTIGATDGLQSEVVKGIAANERIVTQGVVLIKLAQATSTLDAHSGHVH